MAPEAPAGLVDPAASGGSGTTTTPGSTGTPQGPILGGEAVPTPGTEPRPRRRPLPAASAAPLAELRARSAVAFSAAPAV